MALKGRTVTLTTVLLCATVVPASAALAPRAFVVTNGAARYIVTEFPLVEVKKHAGMPEVAAAGPEDAGRRPFAALVSPNARRTMYWWTTEDPHLEKMQERTGSGPIRLTGHSKGKVVVDGKESPTYLQVYDTTAAWHFAPLWPGTFSADGKHYAYIMYPEKNRRTTGINDGIGNPHGVTRVKVVVDGEESRHHYQAIEGCSFFYARGPGRNAIAPMFSPDGKRTAYVAAYNYDDWTVVVDGRDHPRHHAVGPPVFSPDSRKIAYPVAFEPKRKEPWGPGPDPMWYISVDGRRASQTWHGVRLPVFSPDSRKMAYVAARCVKEGRGPITLTGPYHTGVGRFIAEVNEVCWPHSHPYTLYTHTAGTFRERVIVNNRPEWEFDEIVSEPLFSPDSDRLAYIVRDGSNYRVMIDRKKSKMYHRISRTSLVFSPDSRYVAYAAGSGDWVSLATTNEGPGLDAKTPATWSPGWRVRLHYDSVKRQQRRGDNEDIYRIPKRWRIVRDRKEGDEEYEGIVAHSVSFSPNSERFAFAAARSNRYFAVIDGQEGRKYASVEVGPIFSPDSRRTAYVAVKQGGLQTVVVDGVEGAPFLWVHPGTLTFSPDSKHIAYWAKGKGVLHYTIVVDHAPTKEYAFPISDGFHGVVASMPVGIGYPRPMLKWDGPYRVFGAVITGNEICRVEVSVVANGPLPRNRRRGSSLPGVAESP